MIYTYNYVFVQWVRNACALLFIGETSKKQNRYMQWV